MTTLFIKLSKYLLVLIIFSVSIFTSCKNKEKYIDIKTDSASAVTASFVGDNACTTCHKEAYEDWKGSHHDQAMKVADSSSILADFNNVVFPYNGGKATFFKKNGGYYVNIKGADDAYHDYKIAYTFGFTPLQQYIVPLEDGKFQCLTIAWDSEKHKWFDLYPDVTLASNERLHWTGEAMRWNNACADCHSTDLKKNYDSKAVTYHTTFEQINVSCEACHGPASEHVSFYNREKIEGIPPALKMQTSETSYELVEACARCHSRHSQLTRDYTHSEDFLNQYMPALLIPPTYEEDGQILDEDYVYGSFVQSKMYQSGVSCRDCHNVHSLELKKQGNALCLSCHAPSYDTTSHHHHTANTEAALCINCHMTGRTYMQNDFRRDHSFRIPRPDQTANYGTPNACNGCHADKDAVWAVKSLKEWGLTQAITEKNHYSDYMLAGYAGDKDAFYHVIAHQEFPELIRATAVRNYSNMQLTSQEINNLKLFLKDTSALVRNEVVNTYTKINDTTKLKEIMPLLNDPVRMVRIGSGKYVGAFGQNSILETDSFKKAHEEFMTYLDMNADFSAGQEQIAEYAYLKNEPEKAIAAYEKAIAFDDYNNNARLNLAYVYYMQNNVKKAAQLYAKVTEQQPDNSYPYYMLGLLFNELGKEQAALDYLQKACNREPYNERAYYNYAVLLQQRQEYQKSINILNKALAYNAENSDLLYIKLLGEMQLGNLEAAQDTCLTLIQLNPNNQNFKNIMGQIIKQQR